MGAVVLDAGTHYVGGKLVGDAAPSASEKAGFLTPVPGGVGPVTVELLLRHVVDAAEARQRR
jgi:methylenetetrahydrofolate dehydrogenase (NADP+)/methenyltetrahydrofolate cyclohydrolase